MINSVYKTVLALLNKNNYGYVSPADFNLYAKQAQTEIFIDYFSNFNKQVNFENMRRSGEGLANLGQKIAEDIEVFSVTKFLTLSSINIYSLPSLITTGDIPYLIGKILSYAIQVTSGVNTSVTASRLVASAGTFVSSGVQVGDVVINTTDSTYAKVTSIISNTQLTLSSNIFLATAKSFIIYKHVEAEKISHNKATLINTSLLTKPTTIFPAYVSQGITLSMFPNNITWRTGMVEAQYYRYPTDPKWTYVSLVGGAPSFDQSQVDYVDFEVGQDEEISLIIKICQYCGLEIREREVVEFAKREQLENDQPNV